VEYRPGFTECADCHVALVENLPKKEDPTIPRDAQGRELLWSGLSRPLYRAVASALDARHIPHTDVDKEFGILATMAQAATLIWIDPRDRTAAREALAEAVAKGPGTESATEEMQLESGSVDSFGLSRRGFAQGSTEETEDQGLEESADDYSNDSSDDIVENFDPDDATVEVWSGADAEMADTFEDCLNNVGIGCVVNEENEKWRVLVLPSSEKRAREIVREITEASAPE